MKSEAHSADRADQATQPRVPAVPARQRYTDRENLAGSGEFGRGSPFVPMLTQTGQFIGLGGYRNGHGPGCWLPLVGVEYLPLTPIHTVSTRYPPRLHSLPQLYT